MKKLLIALIVLSLALTYVLAACNATDGVTSSAADNSSEVSAVSDQASAEESSREYLDDLPERNFGRTFTILQRTEYSYEFKPNEDESASSVSELVKERNRKIEERFDVEIKTIEVDGDWGVHEDFISYLRNTINGGTADYDLIAGYAAIMPSAISDGLFVNWKTVPYINLDADYWAHDFIDQMTINDRLYLLTGDISMTFWDSMTGMFFNKELAADYKLDLYNMVRNNEWTFDKMYEICKSTYMPNSDLDSRVYSYATAYTTQIDVYQDAFNIPVTTKDADGKPFYTINQEKTYTALQKIYNLVVNQDYTYFNEDTVKSTELFGKGRALFSPLSFYSSSLLRTMGLDFGILPLPKYDSSQEKYNSTCKDYYSVFAIPLTSANDTEFIGIITEALCSEGLRSVVPGYYSVVLQTRLTTDDDSAEMMDIIRDGILCNFGYLYSYTLDWPAHQLNICINNKSTDFASTWQANESKFNVNLEKAIAYYFE